MPKWRKATWAIAIWTAMIAFVMVGVVMTMITQPPEKSVGADLMLILGPANWFLGMLVLGPIWLLSKPRAVAKGAASTPEQ